MTNPDPMHAAHDAARTVDAWVSALYPILGDQHAASGTLVDTALRLAPFVSILQVRLKSRPDGPAFETLREVATALAGWPGLLVVNDRADLAHLLDREVRARAGARVTVGLHLGQTDLHPALARAIVGPDLPIGLSTHSLDQLDAAPWELLHHLALGPIFPTSTKVDADPVVGLDTLSSAARRARRPLVAIGGITLDGVPRVRTAGASAFAVVSALAVPTSGPGDERSEHLANRARALIDAWHHAPPRDRP